MYSMWIGRRLSNPRRCDSNISQRHAQRPCPGPYRVSCPRKRSTDLAIPSAAPGALGASSTPYAPLRPGHDATKVHQQTALNVAPASRPSRRVLAGRGKQLGKDASAARPRKRVRCVTKGTRDPSSPAGGGHLQTIGSTEVWNSDVPTDRREAKFAPLLRKRNERRRPRKRVQSVDEHVLPPQRPDVVACLGISIISHDRPRMRYGQYWACRRPSSPSVQRASSQAAGAGRINRRRLRSRVGQRLAGWPRGLAGFLNGCDGFWV